MNKKRGKTYKIVYQIGARKTSKIATPKLREINEANN